MDIIRTARDGYQALLTELNKQEAPTILIEDFNYLHNKAIQNYVNKRNNLYPIGQQEKDDLAPLKVFGHKIDTVTLENNKHPRAFSVELPTDYFHLQRQSAEIEVVLRQGVCQQANYNKFPITTMIDSEQLSEIVNNYYTRPSFKRVYYTLYQINKELEESDDINYKLDFYCGEDSNVVVKTAYIDYLKKPKVITLTQDDIYSYEDTSMKLQFAPYVNLEIVKELLMFVLENSSDPRLNTSGAVNQSIAPPAQFQQK